MRVLAKKSGSVGSKASSLLNKWRDVVANSQKLTETSSLKENDHPKAIIYTSSKTHHKSEKETKKHGNQAEEKYLKNKHSKKEKHNKGKHEEKYSNPDHYSDKLSLINEEFQYKKDGKYSMKRLSDEDEHEYKKKHKKEKDIKIDHNFEQSKHSIKYNGEKSSSKKDVGKNKNSHTSSKHVKLSKHSSSSLQRNHDSEDDGAISNNDSQSPHNNSDFSAFYEPSPKKAKKSESDSYKHCSESKTKSSQKLTLKSNKEPSKSKIAYDTEHNVIKNSPSKKSKEKMANKESKVKKSVKKDLKMLSTEEFTASEATFEDCLSFNDIVPVKKKKSLKPISNSLPKKVKESSKSHKTESKIKISKECSSPIPKNKERIELVVEREMTPEKQESPENRVDVASTLPQTQPNYRPLPQRNYYDYCPIKKKENMTNEDAIKFTSSRKEKTAVYSGRKNNYLTSVPTLFEFCTRVLIDNIDDIEYMGVVPYFLLESMLQRCTPAQLYRIEDFNPYLLEDTNELWETHTKRDFRLAKPEENETWRELYWRSHDEREQRLRNVTANISALIAKSNPTRKAKLAYVDSVVKPPRDVARRQLKNGTALPTSHTVKAGPPSKASPRPTAPSINSANSAASTSRPRMEAKPMKPKIAPLMAKTLKSMKKCFRR